MSDLISREELLKQIETDSKGHEGQYGDEWLFIDTINSIPTAEPKVGKWIDHSDEGYVECPFCGSLTTCEDNIDELHYCFNCGAKMERRTDEHTD